MKRKARVVIAEDEPLAREALRSMVSAEEWVEDVEIARDGDEAVELVDWRHPDVLFLDVVMPQKSGLEVLEAIHHRPMVVFTTAFDRFAVAAFELEAVDYLVKPFGRRRLSRTLERLERAFRAGESGSTERARAALEEGPLQRVFARQGERIVPVSVAKVVSFDAQGDYVSARIPGKEVLLNVTLAVLERQLDPARFLRVHRSRLVNLDAIRLMEEAGDRRLRLRLSDGSTVLASRAGSRRLREWIR